MGTNLTIAFFKTGFFSNTNKSVYKLLKTEFPNYDIEVIDIWEKGIINYKSFKNLYHAFIEYGFRMFYSKRNIVDSLIFNSYTFNLVKKNINQLYGDKKYAFTFQTQSQYDMSVSGIPHFVYTDHTAKASHLYPGYNLKKESYSQEWLDCEKSLYDNATINFTMSSDISHSMINEYGCDQSKVVCAYVAPNAEVPNDIEITKDKYTHPHILFVGKEWEAKGGPTLLKAFIKVSKLYPEIKLTIVGCAPDISIPNCNVVGRVPVTKVGEYFANASIFCLPTPREAFGIVFLEAMAYYLPVIGTNIGAIPEFIIEDKNGFLSEVNDVDGFAKNIIKLIESPEKCKQFGEFGHELRIKKYTWENVGLIMKKNINNYLENQI